MLICRKIHDTVLSYNILMDVNQSTFNLAGVNSAHKFEWKNPSEQYMHNHISPLNIWVEKSFYEPMILNYKRTYSGMIHLKLWHWLHLELKGDISESA